MDGILNSAQCQWRNAKGSEPRMIAPQVCITEDMIRQGQSGTLCEGSSPQWYIDYAKEGKLGGAPDWFLTQLGYGSSEFEYIRKSEIPVESITKVTEKRKVSTPWQKEVTSSVPKQVQSAVDNVKQAGLGVSEAISNNVTKVAFLLGGAALLYWAFKTEVKLK